MSGDEYTIIMSHGICVCTWTQLVVDVTDFVYKKYRSKEFIGYS